MDPNVRHPGGGAAPGLAPSAPPPSAPPSYEEAMASAGVTPHPQANVTPYPVVPAAMPMPAPYSKIPQPQPVPMQPNYPTGSTSQQQPDPSYGSRPMEVRVFDQHVALTLSPNPVKMTCPSCQADIKTTTISDHQPSAHVCCLLLFFIGCCLCSCLPYCINAFKSVHHFCPNCKNYIGTWKG